MSELTMLAQPGLWREGANSGYSLEWDLTGNPLEAWEALKALNIGTAVIGLGSPLMEALGVQMPGLRAFARVEGIYKMPATQHALWAYVTEDAAGEAFDSAERLKRAFAGPFTLAQAMPLLRYREGRDLSGYRDGSANPREDAAVAASIVPEGPWRGGSYALVQRYLHFLTRFFRLDAHARDGVVERRYDDDSEIADAPVAAHIRRAGQRSFDLPSYMLRRSMPWGDVRRHGLQFIAFMKDLDVAERMLKRMAGAEDGVTDALLGYTQAETGSYYFCPPQAEGRLSLSPIVPQPQVRPMNDGVEVVERGPVRIRFQAKRCIHSRFCVLTRPDVFVPNVEGEWIHPERATPDEIVELAHLCPSGAIQYDRLDDGPQEQPPMVNLVRLRENGPYAVHADIRLAGQPAQLRATLCRCGASKHKPYCDGSHTSAGFVASGEATPIDTPALPTRDGPLHIDPMLDGPLVFSGPVEIVSGTGKTLLKSTHPTLCRCGHSANKPFCDGSHARVGFRAEGSD